MATQFKTLREYLYPDNGPKIFEIPNYQRGYKWSVKMDDADTSVEYLMEKLIDAFKSQSGQQFFLQGVTVVEDGNKITLIDGQQRTTTLYLLLWCLGRENITGNKNIDLDYTIRERSKEYLKNLKDENFDYQSDDKDDLNQDIYYFKQAIKQINDSLPKEDFDKDVFAKFLLDKISLLYIVVDKDKAVRTFTMMNGQKAKMHDEELVKAEILHIVSLSDEISISSSLKTLEDSFAIIKEVSSSEWETNALRSKYAREWDKWLYWWNRKDVKDYFNTANKPMGLLLEYYYKKQKDSKATFSFNNFKQILPDNDKKQAKEIFKGLRDLQKDFEDVYNEPIIYNYLKCALISSDGKAEDKYNIIMYFIEMKRNKKNLSDYAKWRLIGANHKEITEEYTNDPTVENGKKDNAKERNNIAKQRIDNLSESHVYNVYNDLLFKQLLRLNVEEYNKLNGGKGVKFDFSIWDKKSLEHIDPKSKYYRIDIIEGKEKYVRGDGQEISLELVKKDKLLKTEEVFSDTKRYSEHCIGNLVLLYGRNNSVFGALPFEEKKKKFFNNDITFESRNLLHTISAFAKSKWEPSEIEEHSEEMIKRLKKDYNID
ncbi:MAG: DUF262 domain-containing protein [Salinivirgaceae bacterium]|nr:DUF262 domain-containing protein [Salinivirgaceae bacterium]